MANNPYVNKVELADGTPVIDISDTTAVASDVAQGKYFYLATGEKVEGESSGGGGITPAPERDVNFIDYDGTILYSYSASDFLALSALPANPTHDGLTAQGWNWTLTDAKTYVTSYGKLWIGQMYITSSGDTEIDVVMQKGRLSPYLVLAVNGTVIVDWGDNTASDTVTGTSLTTRKYTPHTYANSGNYTIKVHSVSGSFTFYGTSSSYGILWKDTSYSNQDAVYANCVRAIRIGSGITSFGQYAFRNSYSLISITIPSVVTSIGEYAFFGCYGLASITIPSSVTSISAYAFASCYSLASITIPNTVTSIADSVVYSCYGLASITIPSSVTSIGSSAFNYCYSLASITIPSSVTSIGSSAFQNCYSFASITIPSSVTSIATQTFRYCYGAAEYHFEQTTPPTLSNTSAFSGIASDCVIYVPYSADHSILNAYKTKTNWSSYASYMQEEP